MDPKRLFRKAALEKLSSPERLDVMMQVTSPAAWLALAALGAVLLIVIVWGIFGSISMKVWGKGILMSGESMLTVTSGATGRVTEILVGPGETIIEGDVVARLNQSTLEQQIRTKEAELANLMSQAAVDSVEQANIVAGLEATAEGLRRRVKTQEGLLRQGTITERDLTNTKQELTNTEQQINQIRTTLAEGRNRIHSVKSELGLLRKQLEDSEVVRSPYTGTVVEVKKEIGDILAPGTSVITLEPFGAIQAVIYVPAGEGKKVKAGMIAQISPSTVKTEEWGFMLGKVKFVSEFPVSPEGLKRRLRNEQLAQEFAGRSAQIEIEVELIPDEDTESGFKWSSSKGPPEKIFSGTPCNANVTVEKKKPISYVLPIFRRMGA